MAVLALFLAITVVAAIVFAIEFLTFKDWEYAWQVSFFAAIAGVLVYAGLNMTDRNLVEVAFATAITGVIANVLFQAIKSQSDWGVAYIRSAGTILGVYSAASFAAVL